MVRSNPIGLAEPSVKRDGYAVGKDGSFYRSSEHLFENKANQSSSRASSEAPDGKLEGKEEGVQRQVVLESVSGVALIDTGKPVTQNFMPFGGNAKPSATPNWRRSSRSKSQQRSSSTLRTQEEFNLQKSTAEIQSLTQQALTSSVTSTTSSTTETKNYQHDL